VFTGPLGYLLYKYSYWIHPPAPNGTVLLGSRVQTMAIYGEYGTVLVDYFLLYRQPAIDAEYSGCQYEVFQNLVQYYVQ
jgi:hypothetical protein